MPKGGAGARAEHAHDVMCDGAWRALCPLGCRGVPGPAGAASREGRGTHDAGRLRGRILDDRALVRGRVCRVLGQDRRGVRVRAALGDLRDRARARLRADVAHAAAPDGL